MDCICQKCNVSFHRKPNTKGLYCSRSCAASANNTKRFAEMRDARTVRTCERCSSELKTHQLKFCNRTCAGKHRTDSSIERWLEGLESGSDAKGLLRSPMRNYLIAEAQNSCTSCKWSVPNPYINKVILTIDHIDGNWKNNRRENLRVLCYNCHTLTPTFGVLNVSNPNRAGNSSSRLGSLRA